MNLSTVTETFGTDDQSWLGSSHATDTADPVSITVDSTLALTGVIPSGTIIDNSGNINTTTPTGFLLEPVRLNKGAGTYVGAIIRHGYVIDARRVAKGLTAATGTQKTALIHFVID